MKHNILFKTLCAAVLLTGCSLDEYPHTETTSKDVYTSAANYESVLSGLYTSMIINFSHVSDDDRFQNYTRSLIMWQECTTDNMDNVWAAGESTTDLNNLSWTSSDPWVSAIWYHIYNVVSYTNEFIRNSSDSAISGFSDADKERIVGWRNEARCLRALAYYHALDLFPAVSFVTEKSEVGSYIPPVYTRAQLFEWLEGELTELAESGALPVTSYGHVTSATASAILARMYLNAEVYIGKPHYDECIAACQDVIAGSFSLEDDYFKLFNADNHKRTNEIIFTLACDATNTVTWGAGTYLVCATRFASETDIEASFGVKTAWDCLRARPEMVDRFEEGDLRGTFTGGDRPKEIIAHDEVTSGWLFRKWSNLTDEGTVASDTYASGANTDFPVFRLADVYLMLAEAVLRGGTSASRTEALDYVNDIRSRAWGGGTEGNITDSEFTLDFILDERSRELYGEGTRRSDLIRHGKFTSGYNWNLKGGVAAGTDVDAKYALLPFPDAELSANPALKEINAQYGY